MLILDHLWIIPLLPLLGAAINGLFGHKWPNSIVNTVALSCTGLSFACALEAVREFLTYVAPTGQIFRKEFFDWIVIPSEARNLSSIAPQQLFVSGTPR